MTQAPTLLTPRLRLRMPVLADFEPHAEFHASGRSVHEGGPRDRAAAWRIWASDVALWILRGYGPFSIEDAATGEYLGEVGIYQAADFPGPELGWFVVPEAEGNGVAQEAAQAVLNWLADSFDWPFVTSIIDPANDRSIALALRLGGQIDPSLPGIDPGDVVIRHDLRRVGGGK